MLAPPQLQLSTGADVEQVSKEATSLVETGKWTLCLDGKGIERGFKFKGFKSAWDFMNEIAAECKKNKHHPEWSNIYNQTKIRWTTHNPEGLSALDTRMAAICDEAARSHGEIEAPPQTQKTEDWEQDARDCCSKPAEVS